MTVQQAKLYKPENHSWINDLKNSNEYCVCITSDIFVMGTLNNFRIRYFSFNGDKLHDLRLKYPDELKLVNLINSDYVSLQNYYNIQHLSLTHVKNIDAKDFLSFTRLRQLYMWGIKEA